MRKLGLNCMVIVEKIGDSLARRQEEIEDFCER